MLLKIVHFEQNVLQNTTSTIEWFQRAKYLNKMMLTLIHFPCYFPVDIEDAIHLWKLIDIVEQDNGLCDSPIVWSRSRWSNWYFRSFHQHTRIQILFDLSFVATTAGYCLIIHVFLEINEVVEHNVSWNFLLSLSSFYKSSIRSHAVQVINIIEGCISYCLILSLNMSYLKTMSSDGYLTKMSQVIERKCTEDDCLFMPLFTSLR